MAFRTPLLSFTTLIMVLFLGVVRANQDSPLLEETPNSVSTSKPTPPEQDENLLLNTDLPIFLAEPQNSFVVKNRAATLHCRAAHSLRVYFKCNGARKVETQDFQFVDPQTGVRIMEAEANVTRDMVEEFFGKEKFKCECYAWNGKGSIKSQPATVEVAFVKPNENSVTRCWSCESLKSPDCMKPTKTENCSPDKNTCIALAGYSKELNLPYYVRKCWNNKVVCEDFKSDSFKRQSEVFKAPGPSFCEICNQTLCNNVTLPILTS